MNNYPYDVNYVTRIYSEELGKSIVVIISKVFLKNENGYLYSTVSLIHPNREFFKTMRFKTFLELEKKAYA